jgi:hypothetical protein
MAAKRSLKNKKRQPKKSRSSRKTRKPRKSQKKGTLTKDCKHYDFPGGHATVCTSTFSYPVMQVEGSPSLGLF